MTKLFPKLLFLTLALLMLVGCASAPVTVPSTMPSTEPQTVPVTTPVTVPATTPATVPQTVPATTPATAPVTAPATVPAEFSYEEALKAWPDLETFGEKKGTVAILPSVPFTNTEINYYSLAWDEADRVLLFLSLDSAPDECRVYRYDMEGKEQPVCLNTLHLPGIRLTDVKVRLEDRTLIVLKDEWTGDHYFFSTQTNTIVRKVEAPVDLNNDANISMSRDGKKLCYAHLGSLYVYDIESGANEKIYTAQEEMFVAFPHWSIDDSKIVACEGGEYDTYHSSIVAMNADGSHVQKLNFGGQVFSVNETWTGDALTWINGPYEKENPATNQTEKCYEFQKWDLTDNTVSVLSEFFAPHRYDDNGIELTSRLIYTFGDDILCERYEFVHHLREHLWNSKSYRSQVFGFIDKQTGEFINISGLVLGHSLHSEKEVWCYSGTKIANFGAIPDKNGEIIRVMLVFSLP